MVFFLKNSRLFSIRAWFSDRAICLQICIASLVCIVGPACLIGFCFQPVILWAPVVFFSTCIQEGGPWRHLLCRTETGGWWSGAALSLEVQLRKKQLELARVRSFRKITGCLSPRFQFSLLSYLLLQFAVCTFVHHTIFFPSYQLKRSP